MARFDKDTPALLAFIDTELPDNNTGDITPAILRNVLKEIANQIANPSDATISLFTTLKDNNFGNQIAVAQEFFFEELLAPDVIAVPAAPAAILTMSENLSVGTYVYAWSIEVETTNNNTSPLIQFDVNATLDQDLTLMPGAGNSITQGFTKQFDVAVAGLYNFTILHGMAGGGSSTITTANIRLARVS